MLGKWRKLPMKSRRSPGDFGCGAEAIEVHAVGDYGGGHADHLRIFRGHDDHAGKPAEGAAFETAPAEGVPGGGERALAAARSG